MCFVIVVVMMIFCVECSIDIVFQVKLKQCDIVNEKPVDCTVCDVEFKLNVFWNDLDVVEVNKRFTYIRGQGHIRIRYGKVKEMMYTRGYF